MSIIIASPEASSAFVNGISSQALAQIISSDSLGLKERKVWDLVLNWACKKKRILRTAVDARLRIRDSNEEEEEYVEAGSLDDGGGDETEEHILRSADRPLVSDIQLKQLKAILVPLLPAIRFSLFELEDYAHTVGILNYILSPRQSLELQRFFAISGASPWDTLRIQNTMNDERKPSSKITTRPDLWKLLTKHIFETGAITGCLFPDRLEFNLLFRASDHGFLAFTFHQRCDSKGPTITLVKSADGYLFGGVNFGHWLSNSAYSANALNFLFALEDRRHRKYSVIFRVKEQASVQHSSYNHPGYGPTFGNGHDLYIASSADTVQSTSELPSTYNGSGASNTSLAGAPKFTVSDYEVFAISTR